MGNGRLTYNCLIEMREKVIKQCISKKMKWKDGAELLSMHPKALSRLKRRYLEEGRDALIGKKPGPKKGWAWNKTPGAIEEMIENIAIKNPHLGPVEIGDELLAVYQVKRHPVTIWRILKRNKVRYTHTYKRWVEEPMLYSLDMPGEEVQMDACYPYGRARKVAIFELVDDCSRFGIGKGYEHEDADSAIDFMNIAIKKAPFQIKRVRVDNRYGKRFRDHCENVLGIEVIENDPYTPKQNGKVERFHGTSKRHFFYRFCSFSDDLETINYKYSLWLNWYNYEKKHRGYKMNEMTPAQKIATCYLQSLVNSSIQNKKVTLNVQQNIA